MTTAEILITIVFITSSIVQFLLYNSKLNKERKEKEEYSEDSKKVREHYSSSLAKKEIEIKTLSDNLRIATDTSKSWKDANDLKQSLIDKTSLRLEITTKLLYYLKNNWNKHLVVKDKNNEIYLPALRLSINPETLTYNVVTYQGSKNLENKTDFNFTLDHQPSVSIEYLISEINNTSNPLDSKDFNLIVEFLNKNNG